MQQTFQQNMNQQGIMSQPPSVITVKDHLYMTDMLNWNLLAMKKCHFFAQHCSDSEVKQAIEKAGQMHARHYQKILQHMQHHLQSNSQPSQQQNAQPIQ